MPHRPLMSEDHPADEQPERPQAKDRLVRCRTDVATPSLLSSPMVPMWH